MYNLPTNIVQHIYEYDNIYKDICDNVLLHLKVHCFIYRCSECFKPYSQCFAIVKHVENI